MSNLVYKLKNVKTNKQFIILIEKELITLINEIEPRLIRFDELLYYNHKSRLLLEKLQLMGPQIPLLIESDLFLNETKHVQNKILDLGMKYIIHLSRGFLQEEIAIITQGKKQYDIALKEGLEHNEFMVKNINEINKSVPGKPLRVEDIIIDMSRLSYLSYCLQDFKKYIPIRKKLNELMKLYKIHPSISIMINSQKFFEEENYDNLMEIFRLYKNYNENDFRFKNHKNIHSLGIFSEAVFSKKYNTKMKLYKQAIKFNEKTDILLEVLNKDITQKIRIDNLYHIFFHLENAKKSEFEFKKEVKKALDYSFENIQEQKEFESVFYFYYKTKILYDIVFNNSKNTKKLLSNISKFQFAHSIQFQNIINDFLKINLENPQDIISFLYSHKEIDVWVSVLFVHIQKKLAGLYRNSLTDIPKIKADNEVQFQNFITSICDYFKHHIEYRGLHKFLWINSNTPRKELDIQKLFDFAVKNFCDTNNVDINPEVNFGRGPVDFKFSIGSKRKALIELKYAQNTKIWNGLQKQLPLYMKSDNIKYGIFLIILHREEDVKKIKNIEKIAKEISKAKDIKLKCIVINAYFLKKSGSKL